MFDLAAHKNACRGMKRKIPIGPIGQAVVAPFLERDPEARHVAIPRAQPYPAGNEGPGPFLEGGDIIMIGTDVLCGATDLTPR